MNDVLPCICCNKTLKPAYPDAAFEDVNNPEDGTVFIAWGNFGSKVFDPNSNGMVHFLEITICDECLVERKQCVVLGETQDNGPSLYEHWEPSDD